MKIICIGRNYVDHIAELKNEIPSEMVVFMKPQTALNPNKKHWYKPDFSDDIHYECELVLKIAKNGKNIQPQFARNYYNEISLGIDFTARDIQAKMKEKGLPWELAKAFDHSAIIGNFMPKDSINMANIQFSLLKNDQIVQNGNSKHMIYSFDTIISYISQYFTLQQGDLIYTGTPAGVGKISKGDLYKAYIEETEVLTFEIK